MAEGNVVANVGGEQAVARWRQAARTSIGTAVGRVEPVGAAPRGGGGRHIRLRGRDKRSGGAAPYDRAWRRRQRRRRNSRRSRGGGPALWGTSGGAEKP
ncbi:hypothetical protein U9M48_042434 [Paspalum notatum var. saurae]|uniref:Uncharacterized protein n=1 Tax=Paspalum notatum var. saurae TaxID=547442 RepID=A0AAQ3XG63_PASNO